MLSRHRSSFAIADVWEELQRLPRAGHCNPDLLHRGERKVGSGGCNVSGREIFFPEIYIKEIQAKGNVLKKACSATHTKKDRKSLSRTNKRTNAGKKTSKSDEGK